MLNIKLLPSILLVATTLLLNGASLTTALTTGSLVEAEANQAPPQRQSRCKAHPGTSSWPSDNDWAMLNGYLQGKLIKPHPAAAACHNEFGPYDAEACSQLNKTWSMSSFHAQDPTSNLWQNYNNYSCMPDSRAPCTINGFPRYVVNATTTQDVKIAIDFARERNLRLNVKSTGHDFLGRSVQPNSLSIWVHYLRNMEYHPGAFVPQGCTGVRIPGGAFTVGGGTQMGPLGVFAGQHGKYVVGGSSSTVSVGGYISGGGHGVLSGKYGLSADTVLQIEAVTPDGLVVVANECQNQDLFWAMRGGGGSTFAVMTKVTLQAIERESFARWGGSITGNTTDSTWNGVAAVHAAWAKYLAPVGMTGYVTGDAWSKRVSVTVNYPGAKTQDELMERINKVIKEVQDSGATITGQGRFLPPEAAAANATMFSEGGAGTGGGGFPGNGATKLITSWLFGEKELLDPRLKQSLMGGVDNGSLLWSDITSGPGVHNPPFMRGGGNAVNPGWRKSIARPAAELDWFGIDRVKLEKRKQDLHTMHKYLSMINPTLGTYVNEANVQMENWQTAFWGTNYPRLLQIKNQIDPRGLFYCAGCVGSEFWTIGTQGELCRK